MPNYKEVWQYTQGPFGFAEVYYSFANSLQDAATFSSNLLTAATAFRHPQTVLAKIRVSDTQNNRNTIVVNVNRAGGGVTGLEGPDVCSTAAVWTLSSTEIGARRQVWFRGLPDIYVQRDPNTGNNLLNADLIRLGNNFVVKLSGAGYQVRALQKIDGVFPNSFVNVEQIVVTNAGQIKINTDVQNWIGITRVIISQMDLKQWPGLNGHWTILSPGNGFFTVRYNAPFGPGTYDIKKGKVRVENYQYGAINPAVSAFNKFGARDTGKNPLAGRGRRSSSRIRSA